MIAKNQIKSVEKMWNVKEIIKYEGKDLINANRYNFFSGRFIAVVNPPESKLAKRTSVQWYVSSFLTKVLPLDNNKDALFSPFIL